MGQGRSDRVGVGGRALGSGIDITFAEVYCAAEVAELDVAAGRQQDVLRLRRRCRPQRAESPHRAVPRLPPPCPPPSGFARLS